MQVTNQSSSEFRANDSSIQDPEDCAKIAVNTRGQESVRTRADLQNLVIPLDNFDVEEFLHSDHDFWKLCNVDHHDQRGFDFDSIDDDHQARLIVDYDFRNVGSDDHRLMPSSSPVFFSEEMLMEHWSDHIRDD